MSAIPIAPSAPSSLCKALSETSKAAERGRPGVALLCWCDRSRRWRASHRRCCTSIWSAGRPQKSPALPSLATGRAGPLPARWISHTPRMKVSERHRRLGSRSGVARAPTDAPPPPLLPATAAGLVLRDCQATCIRFGAQRTFTAALPAGNHDGSTTWRSPQLSIPASRMPLRLKFVANGHRSSPNTRPLIWDSRSRVYERLPADGCAQGVGLPELSRCFAGCTSTFALPPCHADLSHDRRKHRGTTQPPNCCCCSTLHLAHPPLNLPRYPAPQQLDPLRV